MKYLALLILFVFIGCGYSPHGAHESVYNKYPNSKIANIPGENYRFVVKTDSGEIRYIEVMNITNLKISQDFKCF